MSRRPLFILLLLLTASFSLATVVQQRASGWTQRSDSDDVLKVVLGDGRRLFANHFFVKADIYFHSGYYPSIFDQAERPKGTAHMTEHEDHDAEKEHERQMDFMGPPRDWIEKFGRHFLITEHTHLENGAEREILPWLKISADLDPQRIETYTVAAFWLRKELGKPEEAEKFLREGLRNNPNSYELLFELGRLYSENYSDPRRARNVWELALVRWHQQQDHAKNRDEGALRDITVHLGKLEEDSGNLAQAVKYYQMAVEVSPFPDALRRQIAELKQKLTNAPPAQVLRADKAG